MSSLRSAEPSMLSCRLERKRADSRVWLQPLFFRMFKERRFNSDFFCFYSLKRFGSIFPSDAHSARPREGWNRVASVLFPAPPTRDFPSKKGDRPPSRREGRSFEVIMLLAQETSQRRDQNSSKRSSAKKSTKASSTTALAVVARLTFPVMEVSIAFPLASYAVTENM